MGFQTMGRTFNTIQSLSMVLQITQWGMHQQYYLPSRSHA
jgi:hypothetical protein